LKRSNRDHRITYITFKNISIFLITVLFCIICSQSISASFLTNIPLNSWIYPEISRLNTLQAFIGNGSVALNTLPLTRIEIAYLLDTALFNIQKGKLVIKDSDLKAMEKLILEFQEELNSLNIKIISTSPEKISDIISDESSDAYLQGNLEYFIQQGIIKTSHLSCNIPSTQMTKKQMAILLDEIIYQLQTEQIKLSDLSENDMEKLEELIVELGDELSFQGLKIVKLNKTTIIMDSLKSSLEIKPYFTQRVDFKNPGNQLKSFSELGVKATAAISENSAFYFDYSLGMDMINDFTYLTNSEIKQAYINITIPSFEIATPGDSVIFPSLSNLDFPSLDLQIGRDSMRWGPAYTDSLILSDNPLPFDMLKYSGAIDLSDFGGGQGSLNFIKFFSLLNPLSGIERYFSGQRLEYKATPTLTLGVSETAVISHDSSILFMNPLPFLPPYYLTRLLADMLDQPSEINSNASIDIKWNFHSGITIYGEYMVDDFILTPETNPFPNRTGFLAGAYFVNPLEFEDTDFRMEYTHINNYVYFPRHPWQDYLYEDEFIGNPLGPDADQFYLELSHQLTDELNLSLSYTGQRHGEGQSGDPLPSDPVIANENIFLSGIIEKSQAYQAEISYNISPTWELSASATMENIQNKDNMIGESENSTSVQLELSYEF